MATGYSFLSFHLSLSLSVFVSVSGFCFLSNAFYSHLYFSFMVAGMVTSTPGCQSSLLSKHRSEMKEHMSFLRAAAEVQSVALIGQPGTCVHPQPVSVVRGL